MSNSVIYKLSSNIEIGSDIDVNISKLDLGLDTQSLVELIGVTQRFTHKTPLEFINSRSNSVLNISIDVNFMVFVNNMTHLTKNG